ncbi:Putative YTH domain containing protein [Septoria linicola]|uniref:YTH domain containing protein n=1 Tax=Septoria linicola TaxID=215465 RepID=A0A9Q9EIP6_9PEZI|nr:putative YTH domain containing protein [Septoria linicola]USW52245.1 Putative YTH domain containing protein [Septoria linicola]
MASGSNALSPPLDPKVNDFIPMDGCDTNGERGSGQYQSSHTPIPQARDRADYQTTNGKPLRPTPLVASNMWSTSTNAPARSAGLPPKPSWESLRSPTYRSNPSFTASPRSFGSNCGLGVSASGKGDSRRADNHRLDFRTSGSAVRYTQTEEYHNSTSTGGLVVKTDPLPQHPFAVSRPTLATKRNGSDRSVHDTSSAPISATSARPAAEAASPVCDTQRPLLDNALVQSSTCSDEVNKIPDGAHGDVWTERQHARCLRRALKDPNAEWEETYKGALTVLAAVNPEHFSMPANSRVINIKTEHLDNLITSIRLGKYSVMAKISERIMSVWNERVDASEKVLFLFSVNGSKKFSGLAEVSGPWDPNSFIEGWAENSETHGSSGSFPVTWVFVKDVSYHHFTHIRQPGNEHPVGNMWNGMNFPPGTGRTVIQHYVETPATTSILGYPKVYGDGQRHEGLSYSQRKGNFSSRGQRGGRGSFRGGNIETSWRQQPQHLGRHESSQESFDDENDATPTPASRGRLSDTAQAPPLCKLSTAENDTLQPPSLGSVSFDASGRLVTIPSSGVSYDNRSSTASIGRDSPTTFISRKTRRQNLPRLDVRRSKEFMYDDRRSGPMGVASNHHSTASASSRGSFSSSTASRSGLQHSASMGILGSFTRTNSDDPPMLPPSASMNSMPVQTDYVLEHSIAPTHPTTLDRDGSSQHLYNRSLSLRQEMAQGIESRAPEELSGRDVLSHQSAHMDSNMTLGPSALRHQLMAQVHMLHAEKLNLQHQLLAVGASGTDRRYIDAQLVRNNIELQAVELEMSMSASGPVQNLSPEHFDVFQHGDSNSSSSGSGPNLSPTRASQNSSSCSASLLSSPYSFEDGRSLRAPQRQTHRSQSSWDLRVQSVDDLVSSPRHDGRGQNATLALQHASGNLPSYTASGDSNAGRANFSFHAPAASRSHTTHRDGVRIDA